MATVSYAHIEPNAEGEPIIAGTRIKVRMIALDRIATAGMPRRSNAIIPSCRWPGRPGWLPTQVPHRSGLAHHPPGSSSHEFATGAIRRRCVDMTQVTMYLACFPSTAHETASPSLDGVPRFGSPASTVL